MCALVDARANPRRLVLVITVTLGDKTTNISKLYLSIPYFDNVPAYSKIHFCEKGLHSATIHDQGE